jgi:hydrogenase maturation protease
VNYLECAVLHLKSRSEHLRPLLQETYCVHVSDYFTQLQKSSYACFWQLYRFITVTSFFTLALLSYVVSQPTGTPAVYFILDLFYTVCMSRNRTLLSLPVRKRITGRGSLKTARTSGGTQRILVAGLGNLLLRDDGVGVHAVRTMSTRGRHWLRLVDVGCAVFDALPDFEWARRILLIDAMQAGGRPGTVYRAHSSDIEEGGTSTSLHELSALHALRMINKPTAPEICLIGIEPEIIDYGLDLSESVAASLPAAIREAWRIIDGWSGRKPQSCRHHRLCETGT